MKKQSQIDKAANNTGIIIGILFFIIVFVGTVIPFGIAPDTKAYIESSIIMIYVIGLFIGLKRKKLGIIVCLASMVASVLIYFYGRTVINYTYIIVSFFVQMIPVALYLISWYYHRQSKKK